MAKPPSRSSRDRQLNIRCNAEELARLDRLAEYYGIDAPSVIRMLVKRDADQLATSLTKPSAKNSGKTA